jgi:hypothetical protein
LGKNGKSITSKPTSSLQKNHLAPAADAVMDNHERATHRETDLIRSEDRQEDQAADLKDRSTHVAINFETSL